MHFYMVIDEITGRSMGYYLASSKGEARRASIKHITAKRLDGAEIAKLYENGYGITDASTGKSVNGAINTVVDAEFTPPTETQLDAFDPPAPNETQAPQG